MKQLDLECVTAQKVADAIRKKAEVTREVLKTKNNAVLAAGKAEEAKRENLDVVCQEEEEEQERNSKKKALRNSCQAEQLENEAIDKAKEADRLEDEAKQKIFEAEDLEAKALADFKVDKADINAILAQVDNINSLRPRSVSDEAFDKVETIIRKADEAGYSYPRLILELNNAGKHSKQIFRRMAKKSRKDQ